MQRMPQSQWLYAAQTRTTAKNILWEPLRRLNQDNNWGLTLNETELRARHPNGSWLLLAGMDSRPELEKARGIPWNGVKIDECGSHKPSYLQYYVEQVVHPRLMDRKGSLWLLGTPTPQASGYFFEITTGKLPGFSVHRWTAKDNPFVDYDHFVNDPIEGILALRGWTEDHPIFRREILGEWCVEDERLVYRFLRERNVVQCLPQLREGDRWMRGMSTDFGAGDATACAILAWPKFWGRDAYVEHTWSERGLAPSDAAERLWITYQQFNPDYLIGDLNGMGKGYEREWNKRFPNVAMRAAEKSDKRSALEVTSDALYTARGGDWSQRRGLLSLEGNDELHTQWASLLWDEERKDIADGQDDDISHAVLYDYRITPAWANATKDPAPPPPPAPFDKFKVKREIPAPHKNKASAVYRGAFRK